MPPAAGASAERATLAATIQRSNADWAKGLRRLGDEPAASKKRLFHALRGPTFARQILARRTITDFAAANEYHAQIVRGPDDDPEWYESWVAPKRDELLEAL